MKMSGWEQQFQRRIDKIRDREVKQIGNALRLHGINVTLYFSSKFFVASVSFMLLAVDLIPSCLLFERSKCCYTNHYLCSASINGRRTNDQERIYYFFFSHRPTN